MASDPKKESDVDCCTVPYPALPPQHPPFRIRMMYILHCAVPWHHGRGVWQCINAHIAALGGNYWMFQVFKQSMSGCLRPTRPNSRQVQDTSDRTPQHISSCGRRSDIFPEHDAKSGVPRYLMRWGLESSLVQQCAQVHADSAK